MINKLKVSQHKLFSKQTATAWTIAFNKKLLESQRPHGIKDFPWYLSKYWDNLDCDFLHEKLICRTKDLVARSFQYILWYVYFMHEKLILTTKDFTCWYFQYKLWFVDLVPEKAILTEQRTSLILSIYIVICWFDTGETYSDRTKGFAG